MKFQAENDIVRAIGTVLILGVFIVFLVSMCSSRGGKRETRTTAASAMAAG